MSFNRATLIGNVGADPEIKTVGSGKKVANLRLATTERWKDRDGERQERTEWHTIVVWNEGLVGIIERYVSKGSKIMIEGQIQTRDWEKDGVKRYATEIVLQGFGGTLQLLGDAGGGRGSRDDRDDRGGRSDRRDDRGGDFGRGDFGGGRGGGRGNGGGAQYGGPSSGRGTYDLDDDIPF